MSSWIWENPSVSRWVCVGSDTDVHGKWWYMVGVYSYFITSDYRIAKWMVELPNEIIAGPFESLEAAKAALVMLSEVE